jgi:anti-sigma-K factor RskA
VAEDHERFAEDVAAYALGSLEGPERARVVAHVATCAACQSLLAEYGAVTEALTIALAPVSAPREAWPTIQAAARQRRHPSRWPWPVRAPEWLRVARWPAVAALVAVLTVWNVTLERELTRRSPGPAPGPEVEALSRRPGRIVILRGTGTPGASARIFVAVDGGGHLAVSGLASLPRERTYQLWFVRPDAPAVSGATFRVDSHGRAWAKVTVPATLGEVHTIAVTEEPGPGSANPTGTPLLEAAVWP